MSTTTAHICPIAAAQAGPHLEVDQASVFPCYPAGWTSNFFFGTYMFPHDIFTDKSVRFLIQTVCKFFKSSLTLAGLGVFELRSLSFRDNIHNHSTASASIGANQINEYL